MNRNIPTITVAISALNEQKNIANFLKSVLDQKEKGFRLKEILVHSDGSTDRTVEIARKINDKRIKLYEHKTRVGKSSRLNEIYRYTKTDFLIQSDADVIFAHSLVIHNLIQPLIKSKKTGMCGGDPRPIKAETFIEKAVNCSVDAYLKFRREIRNGNNIFSVDGRLLAYKKELFKKITVPGTMIANDVYTYFCCLNLGYKYKYVSNAIVYFRSPQTLKDHLKQNIRFESAQARMEKYFSKTLVRKETFIPRNILVKNFIIQFLKNPIHCSYILLVNLYCRYQAKLSEKHLTAKWFLARSTKSI